MSRYVPSDYRGPSERPRSPPPSRFNDSRRPSAASAFSARPYEPARNGSDAPRGPRSQFDGPRSSMSSGAAPAASAPRGGYAPQLRDAPPLGSSDRGRSFKDRDFERRERPPSPRERSPVRNFRDTREFPPREVDVSRARRDSRDGPLSAGSQYSDASPFSSSSFRGGFGRSRGRGDFESRGGARGARRTFDDRDQVRQGRDRSPSRWGRDMSRDGRDPERRDDRRFDRREEDRRPEWLDRERDDRTRREPPPMRLEPRHSNESLPGAALQREPPASGPHVNPDRLALLESTGPDSAMRRGSAAQIAQPTREARRDHPPDTPSYLNGRAETLNSRYGARGSSPPAQAPAVPAFGTLFPIAPQSSQPVQPVNPTSSTVLKSAPEAKAPSPPPPSRDPDVTMSDAADSQGPPPDAPIAPRAPPAAPKAQLANPPPAAPKAPRALEADPISATNPRLHGVRSWDTIPATTSSAAIGYQPSRDTGLRPSWPASTPQSPGAPPSALPSLNQPISPSAIHTNRFGEFSAPTGPKASRQSPALPSASPRPPLMSPRSDSASLQGPTALLPAQSPPPTAPLGPRNRSYSISPKATTASVPTGPRIGRAPPVAPRNATENITQMSNRPADRLGAPPWAPPRAPRWNQWRPGVPPFNDKVIPAKRDFAGEDRDQPNDFTASATSPKSDKPASARSLAPQDSVNQRPAKSPRLDPAVHEKMDIDAGNLHPRPSSISNHSAKQSFIGKPVETGDTDSEVSEAAGQALSSDDEDELDAEDLTLFEAKFERQKRELEAQMVDLSTRTYRATTPLESIARLARISWKDVQRLNERGHDTRMEVDNSREIDENRVPATTHSSGTDEGPDLLTPSGVDDAQLTMQDHDGSRRIRRIRRPSPEIITLPYLLKEPEGGKEALKSTLEHQEICRPAVCEELDELDEVMEEDEATVEDTFAEQFRTWRAECEDLDRRREEEERLERQQSLEPIPEPELPTMAPLNPILEGRRLHKFSSEYDIEKVLKESEETARIEQERQEREMLKAQADMQKEARLPDQQSSEEARHTLFIDNNRYRDPESLTLVFAYEPPADNFSDYEQQVFIAAFKESPKKWGKIAEALPDPNKTYKDCIHHYYATKWDGRFRDTRARKLKAGGRRGRGGKSALRGRGTGAMADLSSRVDDPTQPVNLTESGRPRRAAAPNHFGERETDAKAALVGPSPSKKLTATGKQDGSGDNVPEKQVKRRKGAGEKLGRKPKTSQPLATLAAAPTMSPNKHFGVPVKEDTKLEDARLLTSFQAGAGIINAEGQLVYNPDSFQHPLHSMQDDQERVKHGSAAPSKSGASSYWSVPEQSDFVKYIGHFGTDFGAIAAHMGTKTQTMIKNHYQRQVDNGNRPELEEAAKQANSRRERGEDMGPPPTPTPINKRKYDNAPPTVPRTLAPHADATETDEPVKSHVQMPKHTSPPQFQSQPGFNSPAQRTPVPAQRAPPTTVPTPTSIPTSLAGTSSSNQSLGQHRFPPGPRMGIFNETRSEPRPNIGSPSLFRASQLTPPISQPQQQEPLQQGSLGAEYIRNLRAEQDKAFRLQQEQSQQERFDPPQRHPSIHQAPLQHSPAMSVPGMQLDRKPTLEERAPTPPRVPLQSAPTPSRGIFGGSPAFSSLAQPALPMLANRAIFNQSPPKVEDTRSSSAPGTHPAHLPPTSRPPEAPKRSNLLSILNSEPDVPKPAKRFSGDNILQAPPRTESPAPLPFSNAPSAPPLSGLGSQRRETFGQPSMPQSSFSQSSLVQQIKPPVPRPLGLKSEPSPSPRIADLLDPPMNPLRQNPKPPKTDWTSRVFSQTPQPSPSTATMQLEREVRSYVPHHRESMLRDLNGSQRANPSPPPTAPGHGHSRTPSYGGSAPTHAPMRDHRSSMGLQHQQVPHQSAQPLHPNPYAHQAPSMPTQPTMQTQNVSHHAHNSSLGSAYGGSHQRHLSREDVARQDLMARQQQEQYSQRDREQEWRRQQEIRDAERHRDAQYQAQRQEQERQHQHHQQAQQQHFSRPPPPPQPLHPGAFGGSGFPPGPAMGMGLREQSLLEAQAATVNAEQRMTQEAERRRQDMIRDQQQKEEIRRREEALNRRGTPLGGAGYWQPPPRR